MKRIILLSLLALALIAPGVTKAQVDQWPNYGFEKWTNPAIPDSWDTASAISKKGIVFNGAQSGGVVQHLATFSYSVNGGAKINIYPHEGTSFLALATSASQTTGVHAGYIQTKFAYANRPAYFYANIGFFAQGAGEGPVISIIFTKWNTTSHKRDTILFLAQEVPNTGIVAPWNEVAAPLASFYNPNITSNPDTALIQLQSSGGVLSGSTYTYANGTTLLIDNAAFSMTAPAASIDITANRNFGSVIAYPNPFNGKTTVHYNLIQNSHVTLNVYDMQGREISNIVNEYQVPGAHDVIFDGTDLKGGIYFYRLQSGTSVETGKLILNK